MADWESANRVQKNDAGDYRALIGGEWIRVAKAQKNDSGQFRVMREGAAPPMQDINLDPTAGMSGTQKFFAGAGKALTDIGRGATQIVGAGPSREEMAQIQQQDRPLMNTGAGITGNIAGGMASTLPAMAIPGVNTIAGMGALGGALGALQPVSGDQSRLANTAEGAALGVAIPSVIQGAGKLAGMAKNVIDPWLPGGVERAVGRTANAAAGPDKQAIIEALRNPQQIVPGSIPTAAQAAAPVGRAEFSGLQEAVKGRAPTAYENITQAQNAARVRALRTVGQDKAALEAATKMRATNAATNYGAVANQSVEIDPKLFALLENPILQAPLKRAGLLSAGRGTPVDLKTGQVTVGQLQDMKMALDDVIKNPETFGIGASEANLVGTLQKQLVKAIGEKSPGWETARSAYAAQSMPINQMGVGQYLEGKLVPALNDSGASGSQRAAAYAQALRDAPGTLKRATGQPRYDELSQVLNPQQMQAVTNVGSDLARTATHERLARAGSEQARELVGQVAPKVPAAGMFSPHYSVMRAIINRLEGRVEGKSLDRLAEAMQNPQELANVMEGMAPKTRSAIARALREARVPLVGGTIYGIEQGQQP